MTVGIGVIGAGVMGADHARLFRTEIAGAHLAAVADADPGRARAAAAGAWFTTDPEELISRPEVDAVVVASPDAAHAGQVLACIAAGKPVLCEKPLAPDVESCARILAAETAAGRPLVATGFMRRFDPAYGEIRAALASGGLGPLRVLHNVHRNRTAPDWFTPDMAVMNSFVHEIDISRWLLGCEFTAATVFQPKGEGRPGDALLVVLEAESGAIVSTEVFIDARYGYHVHAEAVCAQGTIAMAEPAVAVTRAGLALRNPYPENWVPRFAEAYRRQDQAFADAVREGRPIPGAANARDGLMATHVGRQVVAALHAGRRQVLAPPPV